MSVITKSVKSILQELDSMKQMKNVKIAQFSFLPKENNLIKESKCYKLSFESVLTKEIEDVARNFSLGDLEIDCGNRKFHTNNNEAYFDSYKFLTTSEQNFTIIISQLRDVRINEDEEYFFRFVQPIQRVLVYHDIYTNCFQTEYSQSSGLMGFDFEKGKVHYFPIEDNEHNHYVVIEPQYSVNLDELFKIQYAIQIGIGLITGVANFDEAYIMAYKDEKYSSLIGTSYTRLRESIRSQYSIFTTNLHSIEYSLKHGKHNGYALNQLREENGKINYGLVDWLHKDFYSTLVFNIYNYPEFARAGAILMEASTRSLDYQAALYAVALETLCTKIQKIKKIKFNPLIEKSIFEKFKAELENQVDKISLQLNIPTDFKDRCKNKLEHVNELSNKEKFLSVINSVGYKVSESDKDAIEQRNRLLHGNLVKHTSDSSKDFDDIFYYSLILHRLCACIMFKYCGFSGYIVNNPVLLDTVPACERKEPVLIRI